MNDDFPHAIYFLLLFFFLIAILNVTKSTSESVIVFSISIIMKIFFHTNLSMLAFGVAMATDDNISCDLDCPRNAPCRIGHADFSGRKDVLAFGMEMHRDGMHCECPIGETQKRKSHDTLFSH